MARENCWEFMRCGRGPGGEHVKERGICPAATATRADGFLGGKNGGRACAFIAGTFCGGAVQGDFAQKQHNCFACEFFLKLMLEHKKGCNIMSYLSYTRALMGESDQH